MATTTLNQVIDKIQTLCQSHQMVRSFFYGLKTDLLADKTTKYPVVFLDDNGGVISPKGQAITLTWRLWFLDLVGVVSRPNENAADAISDMLGIATDIMSELNRASNGWVLSDGNISQVIEEDNDMVAGVYVDFSVRFPYAQNICEVPTTATGL